ncbi:hypothetical protein PFFCH_01218 [Plasmodium falciparum FCH/4]|nr:hypothetical protein PFFCH_01218 [Plasmodium falciparum FCH/4]
MYELDDDKVFDKQYDKDDIFYSLLYNIIENNKNQIDLKIPKKELCRRFDWSRWYTTAILEKNTEEKNFVESNATKGIIFSSVLYFIGLVSHLVSK